MKHTKKITILHSNDMHGDFLAEQLDNKLVGGVSMLSGYVEKVRREEKNVLYAIAGDMFRGSVIDSEYKGLSTIEIMNALAPDIVTIGNHEVDYGVAHLLFIEKLARFPIINANLYIKHTQTRLFTPYKILQIDGMNILFIGIITQDVINQTKSESLIGSFVDTEAAVVEVGKICNAHSSIDIDFTVLLTHIGFEEDRRLASQLDPAWGVDLIIGGHSHTFLEQAWEENGIVIAQAGTGTDQIGRFDIVVDTDNNCIDSYTWQAVPITDENCPRNPVMEQVIAQFTCQVDEKYNHIVAQFRRELTHPERNQETELGDLLADIFTQCTRFENVPDIFQNVLQRMAYLWYYEHRTTLFSVPQCRKEQRSWQQIGIRNARTRRVWFSARANPSAKMASTISVGLPRMASGTLFMPRP